MGEVVNVLVAFAVIVFIVRWATSGKESPAERSAASTLGFRPRDVTPEMVETVHAMFPHIPNDNIRYDLLRTGSVQVTSNKLIERGFLPAPPPAYYSLYPRTPQNQPAPQNAHQQPAAPAASSSTPKHESLITRYRLEDRINLPSAVSSSVISPEDAGGKATWESSSEKREASLRERKAKMILAARERLLAQQQKEQPHSS